MRMFTKIGVTLATGAVPVLLWAGTAGAQQSQEQQSQSQQQQQQFQSQQQQDPTAPGGPSFDAGGGTRGGTLANTGAEDRLPLVLGGAALGGAIAVRRGLRHRSAA